MTKFMVMVALDLGLGACGSDPGSRALSGVAIGAGTCSVLGAATTPFAW